MATANDVFAAVATVWASSALQAAYGSPAFRNVKEFGDEKPYIIFSCPSVSRRARTCVSEYWDVRFRFTVWHNTPEDASAVLEAIAAVYDEVSLTLAEGKSLRVQRVSEGYAPSDETVFAAWIEYESLRSFGR